MRRLGVLVALAALLASSSALAGRRPYMWTWDTEIVPEGDLELEQWLWARTRAPTVPRPAAYWIWWGPVIGLTSHVELALPFQVVANESVTQLDSFDADARIRLLPRESTLPFQPLVRIAYHQTIRSAEPSRLELNAVASYQVEGGLRVNGDLGLKLGMPFLRGSDAPVQLMFTYGAGLSYPLGESGVRLSAEVFGEHGVANTPADYPHIFAGPSVSWTRGRIWLTAGTLIGLTPLAQGTPYFMPRLIWAVAL